MGAIGAGVAASIVRAGIPLVAFDPRPETNVDGIEAAESPREVAERADVVLVAVFDDEQVRQVLEEVLTAADPPRDVLILSTVTMDTIRWAAERCATREVTVLDCGVTGGAQSLAEDSLVVMIGGDDGAVGRVRVVLETFSSLIVHAGPIGAGMQAKLARNIVYFAGGRVAWEAARLAQACGINVVDLIAIVDASDGWTGGSTALLKRGFTPDLAPPTSPQERAPRERMAGFAHKDLAAALALAHELGLDLPMATLAHERFDEVVGLSLDHRAKESP
jgi:3-hydroxyisobutyrate dehydrogenase-like beta-hydroxyacid dehydrogenase